ncbi:MAG: NF038122 family metalloprotease [Oculatellaceae cyanobacterium Prado106]|jgi:hypothetical protein|nr:NF038122 family metalloprotease [Oculatellaceae cyanobacterium Prado106]
MANFNFSYAPGTSLSQMIGFELAGRIWSSYLKDDITVNIHVQETTNLPPNVIGGALPGINKQDYSPFRDKLTDDASSADDRQAVAALGRDGQFEGQFRLFNNSNSNSGRTLRGNKMNLARANVKALGIKTKNAETALDGYILMRSLTGATTWNYDFANNSVPANTLDFLSVAMHEIGHVLGFISGVDRPGWLSARVNTSQELKAYESSLKGRMEQTTALDMFRFSLKSGRKRDLALGGDAFFSIDNGNTAIASFATGKDTDEGGDGFQASHWKGQGASIGIMKPLLSVGERSRITGIDLRALDVIGWDVASTGMNTPINLASLLQQSKQALAQRLFTSVSWMEANAGLAAQFLSQDRLKDIEAMIEESEVYEGRRNGGGSGTRGSWQEVLDLFAQEGLFSTLGDEIRLRGRRVRGSQRQEVLEGGIGDDKLTGLKGDDQLLGRGGADRLWGGQGNDDLQGQAGRDVLRGGQGDDILDGGEADDLMLGGAGSDRFVFRPNSGFDRIRDFTPGEDKIQLGSGLTVDQLKIEQRAQGTLVQAGDAAMLLQGIQANQLEASAFV